MKTSIICFALGFILLISCQESVPKKPFTWLKTERSGCFNVNTRSAINTLVTDPDTLSLEERNDTLLLHTRILYNCCGILEDSISINDNLFRSFVSDTSRYGYICNCLCTFEFIYYFGGYKGKPLFFQLYVKQYGEKEYKLWKEICRKE